MSIIIMKEKMLLDNSTKKLMHNPTDNKMTANNSLLEKNLINTIKTKVYYLLDL